MGFKLFVIFLSMLATRSALAQCPGRMVNSNTVASILQDILSPANTQRAMQMIKMAANGSNRQINVPEVTMPARFITKPVETAMPVQKIMPTERRPRAFVANKLEPPRIMANLEIMPVRNDRMPVRAMPTVNPVPEVVTQQFLKQPMVQPYPIMGSGMANYASLASPQMCPARNPSLMSPFLPVASPVSPFAPPASNLLPPPTQARNQFLRKIPIPPPTL